MKLNFLAYSPDETEGSGQVDNPSEDDTATDTSEKTDVAGEGSDKGEEKPVKKDQSAPDESRTEEETFDDGDDIKPDVMQNASAKVAKKNRKLNRENAGLKGEIDSMKKDAEDAPTLREENARLARDNIVLKLAGKYGMDPKLLEPIKGTEKEVEEWILNFTHAEESEEASKTSTEKKKESEKTEEASDDQETDDNEKKDEEDDFSLENVDKDRPKPKRKDNNADVSTMTHEEKLEHYAERL